ncbi:DUF742 domain-containing protein [Streptomyces sp. NPDC052036]|uniref:DUF742 domain-containing protein n=1 Tax=unclassified Streptomyces TaxID=2593676 RepID=UPI003430B9C1
MVRGRTQSRQGRFDLIAFVVTLVDTLDAWMQMEPEHHRILELCRHPRTVTEVAARLRLPVGVVRVMLGDLLDAQAVLIHEPADPAARPGIDIIREVLDGLRAL